MRMLIEKYGGTALTAPSMKEVPLADNPAGLKAITQLTNGKADILILLTGVGTTAMLDLARTASLEQRLLERMSQIPIVVRGPKPTAVLHRLGLEATVRAAVPNTSNDIIMALDASDLPLKGRTVAVQEYGIPSPELVDALRQRGASILPIPVYRWALPDDVEPLQKAIQTTIAGGTDLLLFTSAQQVRHVLEVAGQLNLAEKWLQCVPPVASIGPTCTEALRAEGLDVWFEATPPKMGPLVRGALERLTS
jgi:uroporphyrinogen-III synthase